MITLNTDNFESQFLFYLENIAPSLGVNQQTVYLFVLGEAIKAKSQTIVFSIKAGRKRMGLGTGDAKRPMAENTVAESIQALAAKNLIEKLGSERHGTRLRVIFPLDAGDFQPVPKDMPSRKLEEVDFFAESEARSAILRRELQKCFYCLRTLDSNNHVMEHVVSRPLGDNSYRNIVAACRTCNNSKDDKEASDYFRILYRNGVLNDAELSIGLSKLNDLKSGKLVPQFDLSTPNSNESWRPVNNP